MSDDKYACSTISPGAVKAATDAVDKAAKENLPVLRQGEEILVVELPENKIQHVIGFDLSNKPDVTVKSDQISVRDCSTCRWGDKSPLDDKHLCWGLESVDAEICRKNGFSSWEAKREGISHGNNQ